MGIILRRGCHFELAFFRAFIAAFLHAGFLQYHTFKDSSASDSAIMVLIYRCIGPRMLLAAVLTFWVLAREAPFRHMPRCVKLEFLFRFMLVTSHTQEGDRPGTVEQGAYCTKAEYRTAAE